ncbi:hypothetical protein [Acinetobacter haemolyticus]|uniref:hypothetical protein n=1 Tax=Acinetobacter haemolyticus TaxID=29430 RepID=UPI003F5663CB
MLSEVYWDGYPANVTRVVRKNDEIFVLFDGWSMEYRQAFSGRVVLKKTTEFQEWKGTIAYKDATGNFDLDFKLSGAFEDDSYEFFSGNWLEDGENYKLEILLEPEEKEINISQHNEKIGESDEENPTEELSKIEPSQIEAIKQEEQSLKSAERFGAGRKRATRSDARVRTVQRSIELYYGLPEGSVRLVNPDRSIIHPSAKIGTLRERWMFDE